MSDNTDRRSEQRRSDDVKISDQLQDAADVQALSSAEVRRCIESLEDRMTDVETGVKDNTAITTGIANDTAEMLDIVKSVKGGFKVMGWLGTFAKWVAGIVAMFAAIYAFVQNVRGPH